jgi:hypothetical protein
MTSCNWPWRSADATPHRLRAGARARAPSPPSRSFRRPHRTTIVRPCRRPETRTRRVGRRSPAGALRNKYGVIRREHYCRSTRELGRGKPASPHDRWTFAMISADYIAGRDGGNGSPVLSARHFIGAATTAFSLADAFLPALAAHYAPRASVTRVRACPSLSEMGQPAWAIPTEAFTPCQLRGLLSLRRA